MDASAMFSPRSDHEACKMRAKQSVVQLTEGFPDLCAAVACPILTLLLCEFEQVHRRFAYVRREDNAVAFAAGAALAGKPSLVLMSYSGLAHSADVLGSLVRSFRLPVGFVVGDDRGPRERDDEDPAPMLDRLGLGHRELTASGYEETLRWLERTVAGSSVPAAVLVPREFLGSRSG
jgi:sulfopyruvate decarboxylase TPP-binding subunit